MSLFHSPIYPLADSPVSPPPIFQLQNTELADVSIASEKDVDIAVKAAQKAYDSAWGLKVPGTERGKLLLKLADLIEKHGDELAALEALNNGKTVAIATILDIHQTVEVFRCVLSCTSDR